MRKTTKFIAADSDNSGKPLWWREKSTIPCFKYIRNLSIKRVRMVNAVLFVAKVGLLGQENKYKQT